jgi:hypothetical protein
MKPKTGDVRLDFLAAMLCGCATRHWLMARCLSDRSERDSSF